MPKVNVHNLDLFWRESGEGPPIVLLMGLETDHRGWARLVPQLKSSFRCISTDNRDVGQSGLATAPYSIEDMADDTLALLDHLELTSVNLIGQSMGGAIAQVIAHQHPQRVSKLVLISSFCVLDLRYQAALAALKHVRRTMSLRDYYGLVFPWMYTREEYERPGFIDDIMSRAATNSYSQPFEAYCRQVAAACSFNSSGWANQIGVPTLVVSGNQDLITPPENAVRLHSLISGSQLLLIDNAGHGLALTAAVDEAAVAINRFLGQT